MTNLPRRTITLPTEEDAAGLEQAAQDKDTTISKILWPTVRKLAAPYKKTRGGNRRKGDKI